MLRVGSHILFPCSAAPDFWHHDRTVWRERSPLFQRTVGQPIARGIAELERCAAEAEAEQRKGKAAGADSKQADSKSNGDATPRRECLLACLSLCSFHSCCSATLSSIVASTEGVCEADVAAFWRFLESFSLHDRADWQRLPALIELVRPSGSAIIGGAAAQSSSAEAKEGKESKEGARRRKPAPIAAAASELSPGQPAAADLDAGDDLPIPAEDATGEGAWDPCRPMIGRMRVPARVRAAVAAEVAAFGPDPRKVRSLAEWERHRLVCARIRWALLTRLAPRFWAKYAQLEGGAKAKAKPKPKTKAKSGSAVAVEAEEEQDEEEVYLDLSPHDQVSSLLPSFPLSVLTFSIPCARSPGST